mgnify:CR=1 FL=1
MTDIAARAWLNTLTGRNSVPLPEGMVIWRSAGLGDTS